MRNREKLAAGAGLATLFRTPAEQHNTVDARQDEWRAKTRIALRRTGWHAAGTVLIGIVLTALALVLIDRYPDSGPALFAVQLAAILTGPVLAGLGLVWLFLLARRRRAIRLRTWQEFPARAATLHIGPFRLTTVGLTLPSGMTWVIFPEQIYRTRVRRTVERDGRVLMLLPRPGHTFEPLVFASASGGRVFGDQPGMGAQPYWERRALRALQVETM